MNTVADTLSEGDIVLVDFEAWTDDGDLFDTTRQEVAKDAGWDVDDHEFGPMPVLLGEDRIVPGFEEVLLAGAVGDEGEVDVPPSKGFGEHDPDKVRVFPRRDFEKQEIEPIPGNQVEMGGQRGVIIQATASRVRVDFNHPFAGKTLSYDYAIVDKVDETSERLEALIKLDYGIGEAADFEIEVDGDTARVIVPESAQFDTQWFMAKHRLGHDVFDHTDLEEVELVETLTREDLEAHGHGHGHAHGGAPGAGPTGSAETVDVEDEGDEADEADGADQSEDATEGDDAGEDDEDEA